MKRVTLYKGPTTRWEQPCINDLLHNENDLVQRTYYIWQWPCTKDLLHDESDLVKRTYCMMRVSLYKGPTAWWEWPCTKGPPHDESDLVQRTGYMMMPCTTDIPCFLNRYKITHHMHSRFHIQFCSWVPNLDQSHQSEVPKSQSIHHTIHSWGMCLKHYYR